MLSCLFIMFWSSFGAIICLILVNWRHSSTFPHTIPSGKPLPYPDATATFHYTFSSTANLVNNREYNHEQGEALYNNIINQHPRDLFENDDEFIEFLNVPCDLEDLEALEHHLVKLEEYEWARLVNEKIKQVT